MKMEIFPLVEEWNNTSREQFIFIVLVVMIDMSHSSHQHSISFLLSLCRCLFIKRRVKARFPTTDIDKHRTSQVCPDCHHRLLDVCMKDSINGSAKTTMGLKWCESVECNGNRLKTRDESSCYCIFQNCYYNLANANLWAIYFVSAFIS